MLTPRRRAHAVLAIYAALSVLAVPVFPHLPSPNELTRLVLAASLVDHGELEVSASLKEMGVQIEDLSVKDGRTFSNKAPGLALLSTPAYLVTRALCGPLSPATLRPHLWAMRWVGATLPTLLLGWLLLSAAGRLGVPPGREPVALAALLLATPLYAYGQLLFAHALVAAALFGAWVALFLPTRLRPAVAELLAGALVGLAVFSEYPAAIPGAVLVVASAVSASAVSAASSGAAAFFSAGGWKRPARVALGGLPFAASLLAYDTLCFGSPFALSSAYESYGQFQTLAGSGVFGVGLPTPGILASLLLDPSKGLLTFSPFLVLAVPGLFAARRALPSRAAWVSLWAVPLSVVLTYGGYANWHGGFTTGSRYLVSALPFLAFALLFSRGGWLESGLLGASAAAVGLVSLTFPFVPPDFPLPWAFLSARLLRQGLVAPNLLHLVSPALALAVPFLLFGLAAALGFPRRLAALAGAVLWVAGSFPLLRAFPAPLTARVLRGYVVELYFEREGTLDRELPGWEKALPRLAARRDAERKLPPTSWPF